jgi:hypothetical protein
LNWVKHESGLYAPEELVAGTNSRSEKRDRRIEIAAIALQSLATVVTVPIVVMALLVGLNTYRDQQRINSSQARINQIEQERFEQRYASRVSWWMGSDYVSFQLQNRSPIPIEAVQILPEDMEWQGHANYSQDWFWLPTIPPCTIMSLKLPEKVRVSDQRTGDIEVVKVPSWINPQVRFSDGLKAWLKTESSLSLASRDPLLGIPVSDIASHAKWQPANDCGEGG